MVLLRTHMCTVHIKENIVCTMQGGPLSTMHVNKISQCPNASVGVGEVMLYIHISANGESVNSAKID